MALIETIDPELADVCVALAETFANEPPVALPQRGDALGLRALIEAGMVLVPSPVSAGVTATSYRAPTPDGEQIEVRWYSPEGDTKVERPAVVYVHGGGMIACSIDDYDALARFYVHESRVPLLSVQFRSAPERTGEGLAEDAFAAIQWLVDHADELGVERSRIAVMGDSGGGGVAAGAAILAREHGIRLAKQILVYPMLDDRTVVPDPTLENVVAWTYENNWTCWNAVLGDDFGTDRVSPVAAPGRLRDFIGLPPTYIEVGEIDIFRDECIAYARGLYQAGISCELHVLPGVLHGHDRMSIDIGVSRRTLEDRCRILRDL